MVIKIKYQCSDCPRKITINKIKHSAIDKRNLCFYCYEQENLNIFFELEVNPLELKQIQRREKQNE